jgi:hypothetical protein
MHAQRTSRMPGIHIEPTRTTAAGWPRCMMVRVGFVCLAVATCASAPSVARADQSTAQLKYQTSTMLASAGSPPASSPDDSLGPMSFGVDDGAISNFSAGDDLVRTSDGAYQFGFIVERPPTPSASAIGPAFGGRAFDGITQADQRLADDRHQETAVPPDQGLCVGNGFLLETINTALRVYSTSGSPLTDTIALGPFMGDGHEVISPNPIVLGPQHSDPSCLFDPDTGRFFVTSMRYGVDPTTDNVVGRSAIELAVPAPAIRRDCGTSTPLTRPRTPRIRAARSSAARA